MKKVLNIFALTGLVLVTIAGACMVRDCTKKVTTVFKEGTGA